MNSRQDVEEARKIGALNLMAENFGKSFSDELLDAWLELLEEYPADMVRRAAKAVIEKYEYKTLPTFGVLKKALDRMTGVSVDALELQAEAEWCVVIAAISSHGSYRHPDFSKETAHVIRLMGGWQAVCRWTTKELDFKRRDFISLWVDSAGRVDQIQLGASGVRAMLESGQGRNNTPGQIGDTIKAISGTSNPGNVIQIAQRTAGATP